jgi:anti-sigma regulatory factor (Ser/Thr protein kinase)
MVTSFDHQDDVVTGREVTGHGVFALPFDPSSPAEARALLASGLSEKDVPQSVVDDAVLVVSELVTNGVRHGAPRPDGTLEVSWRTYDGLVQVAVCDGGTVETLEPLQLNDVSLSGRGLHIVNYVADSWRVENEAGTRIVADLTFG